MLDLQQRRADLMRQKDQALANANFLAGQLALIEELLAPPPLVEDQLPPAIVETDDA